MRVRPRNELMEAFQLTWDNAEEIQKKLGGKLLWGPRIEGVPQPVLEFPRERGYIKSSSIPSRANVGDWILVDFGGSIVDIANDQRFHAEYDPDDYQDNTVTTAFWNRRLDYSNEHIRKAQEDKVGE